MSQVQAVSSCAAAKAAEEAKGPKATFSQVALILLMVESMHVCQNALPPLARSLEAKAKAQDYWTKLDEEIKYQILPSGKASQEEINRITAANHNCDLRRSDIASMLNILGTGVHTISAKVSAAMNTNQQSVATVAALLRSFLAEGKSIISMDGRS